MLIVTWDAHGFLAGLGNVYPSSVDLSHFCKSFRVESKTKIKMNICHDVLLINEVHNVIEKKRLLRKQDNNLISSYFGCKMEEITRFLGS